MVSQNQNRLIEQFTEVAKRVETTVQVIKRSPESLGKALLEATQDCEKTLLAEPDDLDPKLFSAFKEKKNIISNPTDEQLATAQVGITDAFAGVARTGSVCVSMTNKMGGSYSLFTDKHIAVLEAKSIVARPRDVFEKEPYQSIVANRDFVFISGSSATADMGPLVRGVHGPGKFHIIILE